MKKIKMLIELEYDDQQMHGDDEDAIDWFYEDVLEYPENLELFSEVLGDVVGTVNLVRIIDDGRSQEIKV